MKNYFAKKVLSAFLILALSLVAVSPATIAAEPANSHDSDIRVFSAYDQFAKVFPDASCVAMEQSAKGDSLSSMQTGGDADYTYTITVDSASRVGTASVSITLNIGEHAYPLAVSGDVRTVSIREDIDMISGNLFGSVDIGGRTYDVDCCLRKFSTDERINMGLSLVPPDYNTNPESNLVLLTIGASVMTGDIADAYLAYASALANGNEE